MSAIVGTNVGAPIVPTDTADDYPSHEAAYGKGGWRTVADTTARDAIPSERREEGMVVYCQSDEKEYQLINGITNSDWAELLGATGSQGDTGAQGVTGLQGAQGDQGDTGAQGIQGIQGDTGAQGIQGDQGDQGETGVDGPQGIQGDQGDQGETGVDGPQGIQGDQGDQGETGVDGPQGIQGDTGVQGIQGVTGLDGLAAVTGVDAGDFLVMYDADTAIRSSVGETGGDIVSTLQDFVVATTQDGTASNPGYVRIIRTDSSPGHGNYAGAFEAKQSLSDSSVSWAGRIYMGHSYVTAGTDKGFVRVMVADGGGLLDMFWIDNQYGTATLRGGNHLTADSVSWNANEIAAFGVATGLQSTHFDVGGAITIDQIKGGVQFKGIGETGGAVRVEGFEVETPGTGGVVRIRGSLLNGSGLTGPNASHSICGFFSNEDLVAQVRGNGDIYSNSKFVGSYTGANSYIADVRGTTGTFSRVVEQSGSFTIGLTGVGSSTTSTAKYRLCNRQVTLYIPQLNAYSNSTETYLYGIPAAIQPTAQGAGNPYFVVQVRDVGAYRAGMLQINAASFWTMLPDTVGSAYNAWGDSGYKGLPATMISYHLD